MLADNGGATQTIALLLTPPANPAIDTGDATVCSNAPVNGIDQRGVTRPAEACDIGAFELSSTIYLPIVVKNN